MDKSKLASEKLKQSLNLSPLSPPHPGIFKVAVYIFFFYQSKAIIRAIASQ